MRLCLTSIVLLSISQYAIADATLNFKLTPESGEPHSISYAIKDQQLRLTESTSERINLFNQTLKQFISYDPKSGKAEMINAQILEQRVNQLNRQRLEKLAAVKKQLDIKLEKMTAREREIGEELVNQLAYPEYYGEHTLLKVVPTEATKQIAGVECKVYQLIKEKDRLKEFCVARQQAMNLSEQDYQTLRHFYAFDYNMLSRLMLAMGKSSFTIIDYDKNDMPGIIIETIEFKQSLMTQHMILTGFDANSIDPDMFKRPE